VRATRLAEAYEQHPYALRLQTWQRLERSTEPPPPVGAASAAVPEGVEATAKDGNLTLTGSVKYGSQRGAAESAVSALTGVRDVRDNTDLGFDVDPDDVNRQVSEALRRHAVAPGDSSVVAVTSGNTVMLSGRVRTQAQRDDVVGAAWRGRAVMAVIDDALQITG
jgi:osmotically-inducible protein OsmY